MTISYTWLRTLLRHLPPADRLSELLTQTGLEVESVEHREPLNGGLRNVVVGLIESLSQHPDADRLRVAQVHVGAAADGLLQIVCGAPNAAQGQKVLVALEGAVLQPGTDKELKIKRSKIRGVESRGMICAEDELGLGTSHDGIMVLPETATPGMPAHEFLGLETDTIFEIGLTPNRTDAMSHMGVVTDICAVLNLEGQNVQSTWPDVTSFSEAITNERPFALRVEDITQTTRYVGLVLGNVVVAQSPRWLQNRLLSIGIQPINNVVDITNFVMHELGQPLHAFDTNSLKGDTIVVRMAREGEKLQTLDGVVRDLSPEDLVIADAQVPVCLAGVFGGKESGVTGHTRQIFLESACFSATKVRKTARRHGLHTDASFRFERGTDPSRVDYALKRAALLLQEICGARPMGPLLEWYPVAAERLQIRYNLPAARRLMGVEIPPETVRTILHSLDFEVVPLQPDEWAVKPPLSRVDVTRPADVTEEVLRIYGYNRVPLPTTVHMNVELTPYPNNALVRNKISDWLSGSGYFEALNNSLVSDKELAFFPATAPNKPIEISNPLSSELSILRTSLLPGLLRNVAHNLNRQVPAVMLYEWGKVYGQSESKRQEHTHLAFVVCGQHRSNWNEQPTPLGFTDCIQAIRQTLLIAGIREVSETELSAAGWHEGGIRFVNSSGEEVGCAAVLSRKLCKAYEVKQAVSGGWLNWSYVKPAASLTAQEIAKFPSVRRDLAVIIDRSTHYAQLEQVARDAERKLLRQVDLFDVYEDEKIPAGKRSYALSFTLSDNKATLSDKQIEQAMARIRGALEQKCAAEVREG